MSSPGVNVIGYLSSEKGLGEAARGLLRGLAAAGIPAARNEFVDTGSANVERGPALLAEGLPFDTTILAVNPDNLHNFERNVDLRRLLRGRRTIGYWFWEQDEFPERWVEQFDWFEEIWVGSSYNQDVVSRAVRVPVIRVPPALDIDPAIEPLSRTALGIPEDAFAVAFIFDAASIILRKNPVGLIETFQRAFPIETDVRLVLKVSRLDSSPDRSDFLAAAAGDPRIVILSGVLNRRQLHGLLGLADCYISLHRSEGLGLTLAEAMNLGTPTIATGFSGNLDFMTPFNSRLVDYRLTPLLQDRPPYRVGQLWAEPDVGDAASHLRWVYAHRYEAARMGERGRGDIRSRMGPDAVGERMARRLHRLRHRPHSPRTEPEGWLLEPLMGGEPRTYPAAAGRPFRLHFRVRPALSAVGPLRLLGHWTPDDVPVLDRPLPIPAEHDWPGTVVVAAVMVPPGSGSIALAVTLLDGTGAKVATLTVTLERVIS